MASGIVTKGALAALGLVTAVSLTTAQAPPQAPTFRAGVTLVTTDVIPRDGGGRFVSDLTRDDFTVLEDGVRQEIASFSLVHGGRTFTLVAPPPPPVAEGIILPASPRRPIDATAGRLILIFVDDLHFEAEYTPHVRRLIETLSTNLLHDGDMMAMISSGPSSIEVPATYDRKMVVAAASKIRGSGVTATEIFQSLESSQGPGDLRQRARTAFFAAYDFLGELEQVQNKRKVVIYISTGYDFDPYALARFSKDRIMGGRFADNLRHLIDEENPYYRLGTVSADVDLYALMRELTLTANRANATLFTVDPRGLAGVVDAGQYLDQSEIRTFLQKTQSSLRFMAEETGGFAVVNANDFATEFKRIDAQTSDYYVIGYYSSNPDPTQRVRELEITTTRPGVEVQSRRAYSLKSTR
ncbi:MAG: VWA domain-containing protein [Vicinamibacterales bacterium]|nr:VWA domain-containing protein [Vicinamibacterales bacterium]